MQLRKHCLAAAVIASLLPVAASASSHREAPNIAGLPNVDSTDFYLFNSYEPGRGDYVTVLANYIPLQQPYGGPNYFALDANALYEIHIDNDGDARENLTFQFRFTNRLFDNNRGIKLNIGGQNVAVPLKNVGRVTAADNSALNFRESYQVNLVRGPRRGSDGTPVTGANGATTFGKPYDYVGTNSLGTAAEYKAYADSFIHTINVPGCNMPGRVFVGQRREGFAVNLGPVFDLVNFVPVEGDSAPGAGDGGGFPGGIKQSNANNQVRNANVTTMALELHKSCLTGSGNGVIGGWTSASLPQIRLLNPTPTFARPNAPGGAWIQVSRLGMPLVNELGIGLPDKDRFSASEPNADGQFLTYVTNPTLPALLDALFRGPVNSTLGTSYTNIAPGLPRNDLVTTLLTGFANVNQLATVTPSEMTRLNTGIAATPAASQSNFGVAGGDLAGFPNGRRPGDDTVDISLRVFMGALCYPLTIGGNSVDLKVCDQTKTAAQNAPVGFAPFTDGAPVSAADFDTTFPYLTTPLPGSGSY
ncbi:MAG TPA: DUF4331 domain-containing protein [Steroidobacteraceae bacterium]|nr:DUF4331 domain-containing protein [Steroidobacteraceae bacterium]